MLPGSNGPRMAASFCLSMNAGTIVSLPCSMWRRGGRRGCAISILAWALRSSRALRPMARVSPISASSIRPPPPQAMLAAIGRSAASSLRLALRAPCGRPRRARAEPMPERARAICSGRRTAQSSSRGSAAVGCTRMRLILREAPRAISRRARLSWRASCCHPMARGWSMPPMPGISNGVTSGRCRSPAARRCG
ncbi:hypothetical protein D9M73_114190 [compost metagenome]